MAFGIKASGYFLDLNDNSQMSFEINTELWVTGEPTVSTGSYSFPFELPLTTTNQYVLRNPHRVDAYTRLSVIEDVVVYMGEGMSIGMPVFVGRLFIKSASSSDMKASCFVVVEGLGRKKELKFSDVDMGVFNLGVPVSLKAVMDYSVDNPLEQPFVFFPVMNNTLYDEYTENWVHFPRDIFGSRIINDYYDGDWGWNSETDPDKAINAMLIPFMRLEYVLERLVENLDYTLVNDWMADDDELRSICLFNNKSINDLSTTYKNIIKYNEHLPSQMQMVEFLKIVSKWAFCGLFVNHFTKTIVMRPYKHVLSAAPRHNWTDRVADDDLLEQDNKVPYALDYDVDSNDKYFSQTFVSTVSLVLNGAIIAPYNKAGGDIDTHGLIDGYYKVMRDGTVMRYDPAKTFAADRWTKFNHQFESAIINGNGERVKIKAIPCFQDSYAPNNLDVIEYSLPRCDYGLSMYIKIGDEVKTYTQELSSIRLMIYRGRKNFIGASGNYPYANNSAYDPATQTESYNHSLLLDGEKGIYEQYGKEWMTFMKEKKIVTIKLRLTLQDILNHREYDKIRIGNMDYLVKSLKVNVTAFGLGLTECTLVSVPFTAKM
jgi:hypothetical protein